MNNKKVSHFYHRCQKLYNTSEIIYKKLKKSTSEFSHFIEKTGMCKISFYLIFNLLATYLREKKLNFLYCKTQRKKIVSKKIN